MSQQCGKYVEEDFDNIEKFQPVNISAAWCQAGELLQMVCAFTARQTKKSELYVSLR